MPSKSAKQAKFMRAVAHSPKFAKKVGVSQSVGKDFEMADKKKAKKFGDGGAAGALLGLLGRKKADKETRDKPYASGKGKVSVQLPPSASEVAAKEKALKAKAERDKAEEKRYRDALGTDEEIFNRMRRSQKLEADEARAMGVNKAKGGKVMKKNMVPAFGKAMTKKSADTKGRAMKKYAEGGTTGTTAAPNPRMAKAQERYDRMDTRFDNRIDKMKARMAGMPTDRQTAMNARIGTMQTRFNDRLANMRTRFGLNTGANTTSNTSTTTGGTAGGTTSNTTSNTSTTTSGTDTQAAKKGGMMKAKKYARGGGIEKKGKTKGKMVAMNKGGKCYAKGGSVDGCAVRGKTRAPMKKGK